MDTQNLLKKSDTRLIPQFGDKIGDNSPTTEQLEMYNLTLPQYQEGVMLITAQLAEKEKGRLQKEQAEQEARQKEIVNVDDTEKDRIADEDVTHEVAKSEALDVEKVADTMPKALLTGDDLQSSLRDLYLIQREKDEKDYHVQKYIQQAGVPQILLPSSEEIQQYLPSRRITEMCRLLEANGLSQFVTNPLQSWLEYFLTARDDYLLFVRSDVPIPTQQHNYFARQQPDPTFPSSGVTFMTEQLQEYIQRPIDSSLQAGLKMLVALPQSQPFQVLNLFEYQNVTQ